MLAVVVAAVVAAALAFAGHGAMSVHHGPCGSWNTTEEAMAMVMDAAMTVYKEREHEHYSENMTLRWVGIHDHVCPPRAPRYSDCSSSVTWEYWTAFGKGEDFLNGEKWDAGYTGTLVRHGKPVKNLPHALKPGDLCFYYHPMHHVAIVVSNDKDGNAKVVSHGMDPVGHYPWDYAPVDSCRRYVDV